MNGDKTIVAIFTAEVGILDITIVGQGTVAKNPDLATYPYGTEVTLTATPDPGWVVSEWSVSGCDGTTCTVIMYGDQSVIVTFTEYTEYTPDHHAGSRWDNNS